MPGFMLIIYIFIFYFFIEGALDFFFVELEPWLVNRADRGGGGVLALTWQSGLSVCLIRDSCHRRMPYEVGCCCCYLYCCCGC